MLKKLMNDPNVQKNAMKIGLWIASANAIGFLYKGEKRLTEFLNARIDAHFDA